MFSIMAERENQLSPLACTVSTPSGPNIIPTSSSNYEFEDLEQLSCFAPRILRRQLLEDMTIHSAMDNKSLSQPSLKKFHGALLFVDISGFTQLSQKLDVDNLRKFINAYFKKLISIVNKYDGEVIKFAGDALYIVWQTHFSEDPLSIDSSISYVLSQAADCALEIIRVCSNYKVDTGTSSILSNFLSPSRLHLSNFRQTTQAALFPERSIAGKQPSTYLNVHCGLSVGTMAGIDIGFDNRWEYFIIGDPLREVAQAEEYAAKGQVAMSNNAHAVLHPDDSIYPCSCQFVESGTCWILSEVTTNQTTKMSLPGKASLALSLDVSGHNEDQGALRVREGLFEDLRTAVDIISKYHPQKVIFNDRSRPDNGNAGINQSGMDITAIFQKHLADKLLVHTHEVLRGSLMSPSPHQNVKTPTSLTHNSKVSRSPMNIPTPVSPKRRGELGNINESSLIKQIRNFAERIGIISKREEKESINRNQFIAASTPSTFLRTIRKTSLTASAPRLFSKGIDVADQRESITLFINLKFRANISLSELDFSTCSRSPFHFLRENNPEKVIQDQQLLDQYQQCITFIISALHNGGGQLRQFIVDDKGTVAIGTFGLRGSVSRDIASSAIDVSQKIIDELQNAHLASASVGVTAGKVYNGLVGSNFRHEFAVMGPSVNMSARLMGKAPMNTILCDDIVKSRDQVHEFIHFGDVTAKGYDRPVPAFTPIKEKVSRRITSRMMSRIAMQVNGISDDASEAKAATVFEKQQCEDCIFIGRVNEILSICSFFDDLTNTPGIWADALGLQVSIFQKDTLSESVIESSMPSADNMPFAKAKSASNTLNETCLTSLPTGLIILEGVHGIGKTYLLQEISTKLVSFIDSFAFNVPVALHVLPQQKLKQSEPFSSILPLLDTMLYRYFDWTTKRHFDPMVPTPFSRRTKMKALRALKILVDKLPLDIQLYQPLLKPLNSAYCTAENEVTQKLSQLDQLQYLRYFLFHIFQTFQQAINRLLFLNIDELYLMDKYSQDFFKDLVQNGNGFVVMMTSSAESPTSEAALLVENIKGLVKIPQSFISLHLVPLEYEEIREFFACLCTEDSLPTDTSIRSLRSSTYELWRKLAVEGISDEGFIQQLYDMTGGNPLYLRELVKGIQDPAFLHGISQENKKSIVYGAQSPTKLSLVDNYSASMCTHVATMADFVSQVSPLPSTVIIDPLVYSRPLHISQLLQRVKRVEEVVAIRFDQLEHAVQLLLKVAAVATSFGMNTSAEMLSVMIIAFVGAEQAGNIFHDAHYHGGNVAPSETPGSSSPNFPSSPSLNHSQASLVSDIEFFMERLCATGTFLVSFEDCQRSCKIRYSQSVSGANSPDSKSPLMDGVLSPRNDDDSNNGSPQKTIPIKLLYNFHVDMEQQVIYDMLLQEQKRLLHGKAAEFYQLLTIQQQPSSRTVKQSPVDSPKEGRRSRSLRDSIHKSLAIEGSGLSFRELHDQALHFEAAGSLKATLSTFFRIGILLRHSGAIEDAQRYFEQALNTYESMKSAFIRPTLKSVDLTEMMTSYDFDNMLGQNGELNESNLKLLSTLIGEVRVNELLSRLIREFGLVLKDNSRVSSQDAILSRIPSLKIHRDYCAELFEQNLSVFEDCINSLSYLIYSKGQKGQLPMVDYFRLCEETLELIIAGFDTTTSASIVDKSLLSLQKPNSTVFSGSLTMDIALPTLFAISLADFHVSADVSSLMLLPFNYVDRLLCANIMLSIARNLNTVNTGTVAKLLRKQSFHDNPSVLHPSMNLAECHLIVSLAVHIDAIFHSTTSFPLVDYKKEEFMINVDELLSLYDFATMHESICEFYGHDHALLCIVNLLKFFYLTNDMNRKNIILQNVLYLIDLEAIQFQTLQLMEIGIINTLLLFEKHEEAFSFSHKLINMKMIRLNLHLHRTHFPLHVNGTSEGNCSNTTLFCLNSNHMQQFSELLNLSVAMRKRNTLVRERVMESTSILTTSKKLVASSVTSLVPSVEETAVFHWAENSPLFAKEHDNVTDNNNVSFNVEEKQASSVNAFSLTEVDRIVSEKLRNSKILYALKSGDLAQFQFAPITVEYAEWLGCPLESLCASLCLYQAEYSFLSFCLNLHRFHHFEDYVNSINDDVNSEYCIMSEFQCKDDAEIAFSEAKEWLSLAQHYMQDLNNQVQQRAASLTTIAPSKTTLIIGTDKRSPYRPQLGKHVFSYTNGSQLMFARLQLDILVLEQELLAVANMFHSEANYSSTVTESPSEFFQQYSQMIVDTVAHAHTNMIPVNRVTTLAAQYLQSVRQHLKMLDSLQ